MDTPLAHVGPNGERHPLGDHLRAVARMAARASMDWQDPRWAHLAGLWHDLGKYRHGFQQYIRVVNDAHIEGRLPIGNEKTHSAAGALHAVSTFERNFGAGGARVARALAYVIAGHHAGLADWTAGLDTRLFGTGAAASDREYTEASTACSREEPELLALPDNFDLAAACERIPGIRSENPLAVSMWVRMLFSTLVDADFLDTEAFMDARRGERRHGYPSLDNYCEALDSHLAGLRREVNRIGRANDPVMRARADVLRQCREKASLPPGVFTLTVPTGGGKTLSSLAFALDHARANGMRRVIYAIPYTSIIEQTADVFARIFGSDAVVEHHSQTDIDDRDETPRTRLACENWDAPLIVTTNVQLFESLFSARTSRCRKLHNLAHSVLILDEAQLLPPDFLQPILDALNLLVSDYGVTALLCTATQPALTESTRFDPRESLRGLPAPTPIVDDAAQLFAILERVTIEWPDDWQTPISTEALANRLANHDCVLAIVNTRKDAADIVAALDAATKESTLHLSAAMCGQHRADVIDQIRERLAARRAGRELGPMRVISTQLVEAGVDIDFPTVYRALAGLDSIAQAAGRCNREGILPGNEKGRVVVFVRDIPTPLSAIRIGAQATRSIAASGTHNALAPEAYDRYFQLYYQGFPNLDAHGIVDLLRTNADLAFDFRSAADRFRLIDDSDQASLIVPYHSAVPGAKDIQPLIERLRNGDADRWLLRSLQRYTVNVRRAQLDAWHRLGDVQILVPGMYLLIDAPRYDPRLGLLPGERDTSPNRYVV